MRELEVLAMRLLALFVEGIRARLFELSVRFPGLDEVENRLGSI